VSRLRTLRGVLGARRWRDLLDVAVAELSLARAQWLVWTRPVGRLVDPGRNHRIAGGSVAGTAAERASVPDDTDRDSARADADREAAPGETERAARWARAVVRASRYGVAEPQCLVRAVALQRLLRSHSVAGSTIRIGVRWNDGAFIAHAWVEYEGAVLGDTAANTASFAPLADVNVVAGAGWR
jgi:hypothetical protein